MIPTTLTIYLNRPDGCTQEITSHHESFRAAQKAAKRMMLFGVTRRQSQTLCVYYPPHQIDRIRVEADA